MSYSNDIHELSETVLSQALSMGASEVSIAVSSSESMTLTRRDDKVEVASSSTSKSLSLDLLIDDKFSSHSTSDLRSEALTPFLTRAFDATKLLSPDPMRALPDPKLMGRTVSDEALRLSDPTFSDHTPHSRTATAEALEVAANATCRTLDPISVAAHRTDGSATDAYLTSNGFSQVTHETWSMLGAEVTMQGSDGKRPEASASYVHRFAAQLPSVEEIANELATRAQSRLNARPAKSGRYTLILKNRAARQLLGVLAQGLSGHAIYHKRSSLAGKIGDVVASPLLTIIDDPLLPMGLGSTPWSGDLLKSRRRTIVDKGVLREFNLGLYYARKLDKTATTGGQSNWVIPPGEDRWQDLATSHPKAILVDGFLGGNANPATGEFSFGVQGTLLQHGEPVHSICEMNISGEVTTLFQSLLAVANDPWKWGSVRSPTLIFEGVSFSGL